MIVKTPKKFSVDKLVNKTAMEFQGVPLLDVKDLNNTGNLLFENSFGVVEGVNNQKNIRFKGVGDINFKDLINDGTVRLSVAVFLENYHKYTKPGFLISDYQAHIPIDLSISADSIMKILPQGSTILYRDSLSLTGKHTFLFPLSIQASQFHNESVLESQSL